MSAVPQKRTLFAAPDIRVVNGVAMGDPMRHPDCLVLDDVYALNHAAVPLVLHIHGDGPGFEYRLAGRDMALVAKTRLRFMCPRGWNHDALVLVAADLTVYLMPLDLMKPGVPYRLIHCDPQDLDGWLDRATAAQFVPGTGIAMAGGSNRVVETVKPGDLVQTRDHGPQMVHWVGQRTDRIQDGNVPIDISQDSRNLALHPGMRLAGSSAASGHVRERRQSAGGFIDYVQLQIGINCLISVQGFWVETRLADMSMPNIATIDPAATNAGQIVALTHRSAHGLHQGLTAAKDPSNRFMSDPSDSAPKAIPATASAARP